MRHLTIATIFASILFVQATLSIPSQCISDDFDDLPEYAKSVCLSLQHLYKTFDELAMERLLSGGPAAEKRDLPFLRFGKSGESDRENRTERDAVTMHALWGELTGGKG
ncbi:PREDICTED: uncharacterized protein LOC106813223 [Priapulus caudatus]|uniref:Uncharacterized protein LOC106813223 n=1 Tax=Priapulus caudatus TaxID=37621 RepID=A0ABM1EKR8_PRICU|nr:PREDICTED: uncharacterized protein LOC106813223 [Priapulus caudatus]